jgi:hypothetical protein
MESENKQYDLKLHPIAEEGFIGTIKIDEPSNESSETPFPIETVIILDRSGSMGDSARKVSNEIIPLFLKKLSYDVNQTVHFITFDSKSELFSVTIERMKSLPIRAQGGTIMTPALKKCAEIFQTFDNTKPIRLLTISDGQVQDEIETAIAAGEFSKICKENNFTINSQAVRLFTSASQPDTTALCSLLQVNNVTTSRLADISTTESNDEIATKIANLFKNDNLVNGQNMNTKSENVMKFPWESSTQQLTLLPGENIFWLKGMPSEDIKIGDTPVKIQMQSPLTLHQFQSLMAEKIEFIVDHMKILKVIGTKETEIIIKRILEYFESTEETLTKTCLNVDSVHEKKLSNLLSNIANAENIENMDSAQKAEYLRGSEVLEESVSLVLKDIAHEEQTSDRLIEKYEEIEEQTSAAIEHLINYVKTFSLETRLHFAKEILFADKK